MSINILNNLRESNKFELSFDIGYSSIGWSVFKKQSGGIFPTLLGAGTVIFDDDACLAKSRAGFRRMRKNIASRRNRIKRLRDAMLNLDVMAVDELDNAKTAYPWFLAAKVLACGKKLSWSELWSVIRYYAHNRGYDGNSAWAEIESDSDGDFEKEANAKKLMAELGYHEGYKYAHDYDGNFVAQQYLPDGLQDERLWHAQHSPSEEKMYQRMLQSWGKRYEK